MTKRSSQQRQQQQPSAVASSNCSQEHHKKDCNTTAAVLVKAGSLEVVNEENFKQRRDGIASGESCQDCLKERGKENGKKSRRRKKREPFVKHNSPIIVRLSDSIKVSVKGKMRNTPKSSDMESACSTDSEDSVSLDFNSSGSQQRRDSAHKDLRTKAIEGHMRAKVEKNFNAFLSAIEKVHKKDVRSNRSRSYKGNLLTDTVHTPPQLSLLNNLRDYHYGNHSSSYLPHHPRALKSLDPRNVKFVQNDLHSKANLEKQDSVEETESVNSSSTDYHSDVESGNSSSSIESNCTSSAEDLSCEELQYLTDYASGSSLMRYECSPHECPECLAAYHAYGHSSHAIAPQRGDFFSFEVLDSAIGDRGMQGEQGKFFRGGRDPLRGRQSGRSQAIYQSSHRNEDTASVRAKYQVTHVGNGQVEVSLSDFHSENNVMRDEFESEFISSSSSRQQKHIHNNSYHSTVAGGRYSNTSNNNSRKRHYNHSGETRDTFSSRSWSNFSNKLHHCDGISVDLTNTSEVTFTVEYHTQDRMAPTDTRHTTRTATNSGCFLPHSSTPTTVANIPSSHTFYGAAPSVCQGYYHHQQQQQHTYSQSPPLRANHQHHRNGFAHYRRDNGSHNNMDFVSAEMYYPNFYPSSSSAVGYFPYTVPYYMTPPSFYMCPPMMSIPQPLCVPRDLECLQSQRLCLIPATEVKTFTASQPPQRPWLPLAHPDNSRPVAIYTVMCYNVLCDKYCTRQLYGYCPSWALVWEYRKKAIMEEIRQYSADIISLQEVETQQFYNFFLPELKRDGYNGIFSPKSRAKTMSDSDKKHVDGCAIFYRATKFTLIKEHLVEFNQLAMSNADGSHDMINRVMTKDNIALAALLETKEAAWENGVPANGYKQPILLATCHIHWDPEFSDVKLVQTMMLMSELKNIIEESGTSLRPGSSQPDSNSIPLLLCGDLNSLPDSGVVEYLSSGKVSANHLDFRDLGYNECLRKMSMTDNRELYTHGFRLTQAYEKSVIPYTNYTYDFKGIIDYIFFSRDAMRPLGLLGPLDQDWFRDHKVVGCPHPHVPSDHLPLLVEIEMTSQSPAATTTGSSNSGTASVRR